MALHSVLTLSLAPVATGRALGCAGKSNGQGPGGLGVGSVPPLAIVQPLLKQFLSLELFLHLQVEMRI